MQFGRTGTCKSMELCKGHHGKSKSHPAPLQRVVWINSRPINQSKSVQIRGWFREEWDIVRINWIRRQAIRDVHSIKGHLDYASCIHKQKCWSYIGSPTLLSTIPLMQAWSLWKYVTQQKRGEIIEDKKTKEVCLIITKIIKEMGWVSGGYRPGWKNVLFKKSK